MTGTGVKRLAVLCLLSLETFTVQGGWWDTRFDLAGANGTIGSLVEFRGGVYAVGGFTRIAGVDAPDAFARWDGTNWVAIQPGLNASVTAAVATDQAIYFAADQERSDQQPTGLLRWDGQTWTALGAPPGYRDVLGAGLRLNQKELYGPGSAVPPGAGADTLIVNRTDIYAPAVPAVGVHCRRPIFAAAKWDGNTWSTLSGRSIVPPAGFVGGRGNL